MSRRQRWFCPDIGAEYGPDGVERLPVNKDDERANLLSSAIEPDVNASGFIPDARHKPVIDVDHPITTTTLSDGGRCTRIQVQHFMPAMIDRLSEVLLDLDLAKAVHSDGAWNAISVVWSVPIRVKDSFTPGHHHLYLDTTLTWAKYARLLDALADAQVLEHGYLMASLERGATFVALKPWKDKHRAAAN